MDSPAWQTFKEIDVIHSNVQVTQDDPNRLIRYVYRFTMTDDLSFILGLFTLEARASTRHKWRVQKRWSRLDQRNNTMERPDVPYVVVNEAARQYREKVQYSDRDRW